MRDDIIPRSLADMSDEDLLDRTFEPGFFDQCTPLEIELCWRLAAALHAVEQERTTQRRALAELWCAIGQLEPAATEMPLRLPASANAAHSP